MNDYCAQGHRVSYDAVRPTKCPSCQGPMDVTPVARPEPTYQPTSHAPASRGEPQAYRYNVRPDDQWDSDQVLPAGGPRFQRGPAQVEGFDEGSIITHVKQVRAGEVTLKTIGELGADGIQTDRSAMEPRAPQGNKAVRADAIVREMLGTASAAAGPVGQPSTRPKRQRKGR